MGFINDLLSLIFPRNCEACSNLLYEHEKFICNQCEINLSDSIKNYQQQVNHVFAGRVPVVHMLCKYVFMKDGKTQKLLHAIKYQGQKDLAEYIGKLFASQFKEELSEIDLIVPIPLHEKKLKKRGFNQSACFAHGIHNLSQISIDNQSLLRAINTDTQTKKAKYERWQNVEGIFLLHNPTFFENKHILLVDDVITTGATIEAAWLVFKDIKGIKVSIGSIAYAAKN
jgi:ComF family protein